MGRAAGGDRVSLTLYDPPGPRGRRRTLVATLLATVALAAGIAWIGGKLDAQGQFAPALWQPFTDPDIVHTILIGAGATLKAAGIAIGCSVLAGGLLAVGRLADHRYVRLPCAVFVEIARSIPLLLLILALFLAFPQGLGSLGALVLGLTIYNGSVLAEVFRAGIRALPRGQSEAAYALGMRKSQVMTLILLPQAVRTMLPALVSQCVVTLKDTALGYVITYPELLSTGKSIYNTYFNIIPTALVVGAIYISANMSLSAVAQRLRQRADRQRRTAPVPAAALAPVGERVLPGGAPV
jgi:glutamate transport system permease protein